MGGLFFVYGPGEPEGRLVPSVVTSLLTGREVPTTDGRQLRDFSYIDDVAKMLAGVLRSDVTGPINVASGVGVRVADIIDEISRSTGRGDLVRRGAVARGPDDPAAIVADVGRLRAEIDYAGGRPLRDGIRATVSWWRKQLRLADWE